MTYIVVDADLVLSVLALAAAAATGSNSCMIRSRRVRAYLLSHWLHCHGISRKIADGRQN
eukprot:scaffold4319_cov133-Skeletonema_dohrnii-CCMP3373.AAC.10